MKMAGGGSSRKVIVGWEVEVLDSKVLGIPVAIVNERGKVQIVVVMIMVMMIMGGLDGWGKMVTRDFDRQRKTRCSLGRKIGKWEAVLLLYVV
jgi:hypothetical protein